MKDGILEPGDFVRFKHGTEGDYPYRRKGMIYVVEEASEYVLKIKGIKYAHDPSYFKYVPKEKLTKEDLNRLVDIAIGVK